MKNNCSFCRFKNSCGSKANAISDCTQYRALLEYIPDTWKVIKTAFTPRNYSRTGYGNKLPTQYLVNDGKINRRVYAICYSNCASFYVLVQKQRVFIHDYQF